MALAAFLHEGRCGGLLSLEVKLLLKADAEGQWGLHGQVKHTWKSEVQRPTALQHILVTHSS